LTFVGKGQEQEHNCGLRNGGSAAEMADGNIFYPCIVQLSNYVKLFNSHSVIDCKTSGVWSIAHRM
jgi:hypothetical protein